MKQLNLDPFTVSDLEKRLENLVARLPLLPAPYKEILVAYLPYISLSMGFVIFINSLLSFIATGIVLSVELTILIYYLRLLFDGLIGILFFLSFSPLLKKQFKGWHLLLYANLLTTIVLLMAGDIVFFVVSLGSVYILFQIKSAYLL